MKNKTSSKFFRRIKEVEDMNIKVYTFILICAVIISVIISYMSWKRRPAKGSTSLSVLMMFISMWIACQLIHIASANHATKIFWHEFKYVPIAVVPIAFLYLIAEYTNRKKLMDKRILMILLIIPIITFIIILTNEYHGLFRQEIGFVKVDNVDIIVVENGNWFWVNIGYIYILLFKGLLLLLLEYIYLPKLYRKQARIIIVATLIPWVYNALYLAKLQHKIYVDITPLAFSVTGLLAFWSLFRYKFLDLVPIAKELVFDSIEDMVIVLDNHMRIVDINLSAKNILEVDSIKVIGMHLRDAMPELAEIINVENKIRVDKRKIVIKNKYFDRLYEVRRTLILDKRDRKVGYQILLHDITEREKIMEEIRASRERAEAANKAKSIFLANMSHEIRTPMNGILGMIDVMTSSIEDNEQRENLNIIKSSAESLLVLINDILDYSKIESRKMQLEEIEFNVRKVVEDSIKLFTYKGSEKGLEVTYRIDDEIPHQLFGDPLRLRQVVNNLVSNAVKFTSKGFVKAEVKTIKHLKKKVILRFVVSDTGVGIPRKKIGCLFNSFEQIDSSTTRKYGGTGLGLAIVRDLVELMNGSIEVKSEINKGSSFIVDIPFRLYKKEEKVLKEIAATKENTLKHGSVNILLAEDNKVNQLIMMKMFKKNGVGVEIAENGKAVLEKLGKDDFDIILMDVQMPVLDGYETTRKIRDKNIEIPIIALTANALKGDREKCIECGMNDYIAKPVSYQKIVEIIDKYI